MSMRLQVLMDESELREIRRMARSRRLTVSEWVRRELRSARNRASLTDPGGKLAAVAAAVEYEFPTGDIGQMLSEIEIGRDHTT